jgi:hypothetical protein
MSFMNYCYVRRETFQGEHNARLGARYTELTTRLIERFRALGLPMDAAST